MTRESRPTGGGAAQETEGRSTSSTIPEVCDTLAQPDHIRVDSAEYNALRQDAAKWRALEACPHVAELIAEWLEWHRRRDCRDSSNAISSACRWGSLTPSYRELQRRRSTYTTPALTPEQITARARESWRVIDGGRQ